MRKKPPYICGDKETILFGIGTIKNPQIHDSHGHSKGRWKGNWYSSCVNQWAATLGKELTIENAIHNHLVVTVHELTHALSEIECWNDDGTDWDTFLEKIC